jgi:cytochrome P450
LQQKTLSFLISFKGKYDLKKLHEANQDKCRQYGPIVREEFQPGHPVIHLFDPVDFETVFRNQGTTPLRPANEFVCHYRAKYPHKYPNAGIANLQGKQWAEQRRLMAPAMLGLGALDAYLPQLNSIIDELTDCITNMNVEAKAIEVMNIQNLTFKLALESICSLSLDTRLHCFDRHQITSDGQVLVEATKRLFDAYQKLYYAPPLWKLYETKAFKQLAESESIIYATAGRYIQQAMLRLSESGNIQRPSLLRSLVAIESLDKRDIHTLILDFIAGGINTTSNVLAVALHHLAANSDKQENLFAELAQLFPELRNNNKFVVEADRLNKSKYLRACLKESFRLDSPIPCVVRTLTSDLELSGYLVPKGVIFHLFFSCVTKKTFNYFETFQISRQCSLMCLPLVALNKTLRNR